MKKEEKKYYVYVYLDPTKPGTYRYPFEHGAYCPKFEPIYVGAGSGKRYRFFLLFKSRIKNEALYNKIVKIRERNFRQDPIVKKIKIGLSRNESFEWETKLIIAIGRLNLKTGPLFNRTNGGPGSVGVIRSKESKKKAGEKIKKRWENLEYKEKMKKIHKKSWKNLTEERRSERIKQFNENKKSMYSSPESKEKLGNRMRDQWKDPEWRKNTLKAVSERNKRKWKDPEYRKKMITAIKSQYSRFPSNFCLINLNGE